MSKFTSGPWEIDPRVSTRVRDAADTTIASAGMASRTTLEDAQANANLIAAAPEMYEALKGAEIMLGFLLEYAERHPKFTKVSKRNANVTRCRIMDAIAKADGGQQ